MSFGAIQPTQTLSVTASSGSVAIPVGGRSMRVVNTSTTVAVFGQFGIGSATAVIPTPGSPTSTFAVLPNTEKTVDVPLGSNFVAFIGNAAGPTNVYFTLGSDSSS